MPSQIEAERATVPIARQEEERSGYAKAEAADIALADQHDALLSQIALARPTTMIDSTRIALPAIAAAEVRLAVLQNTALRS